MKKILLSIVLLAIGLVAISQNEFNNGSGDSFWGTDANWSYTHAPDATEDVVIPTGEACTIQSATDAYAKTVTVEDGASLDLQGTLTILGLVWNDVTNPITERTWMDRNLGASRVATDRSDVLAYGSFYQWGRLSDGHQSPYSATNPAQSADDDPGHGDFIIGSSDWLSTQNDGLWQGLSGTNNPCPTGYRVPTVIEWEAERGSWDSHDDDGAFGSVLKLTTDAGDRDFSTGNIKTGDAGYWSSKVSGVYSEYLYIDGSSASAGLHKDRANGYTVRCIKGAEEEVQTVTNPTTLEIWMDRNLGASRVATSSTDPFAYGSLYQWGRFRDGHQSRFSNTTTVLSTTDVPGHGDFIATSSNPFDWRNPKNDNLWQGTDGINNPCPDGFRLPTETEWEAERVSWATQDPAGAFGSPLKLTVGGNHAYNGLPAFVGEHGYYWSSSVVVDGESSIHLKIDDIPGIEDSPRSYGYSVRCIKD